MGRVTHQQLLRFRAALLSNEAKAMDVLVTYYFRHVGRPYRNTADLFVLNYAEAERLLGRIEPQPEPVVLPVTLRTA